MNLTDWVDELVTALDVDIEVDVDGLLEVARDVAHSVDRTAAPVSTFLIGYAAALNGGGEDKVNDCIDTTAALAARQS
jgi:uncharacterized protein DUF6457